MEGKALMVREQPDGFEFMKRLQLTTLYNCGEQESISDAIEGHGH